MRRAARVAARWTTCCLHLAPFLVCSGGSVWITADSVYFPPSIYTDIVGGSPPGLILASGGDNGQMTSDNPYPANGERAHACTPIARVVQQPRLTGGCHETLRSCIAPLQAAAAGASRSIASAQTSPSCRPTSTSGRFRCWRMRAHCRGHWVLQTRSPVPLARWWSAAAATLLASRHSTCMACWDKRCRLWRQRGRRCWPSPGCRTPCQTRCAQRSLRPTSLVSRRHSTSAPLSTSSAAT